VIRGNNNSANVRGNNSRALAGGAGGLRAFVSTARASDLSTNNNRASVRGNDSVAVAGPGSDSRARVVGDGSSATARDGQKVTSRGNGVHNPPRNEEAQKQDFAIRIARRGRGNYHVPVLRFDLPKGRTWVR